MEYLGILIYLGVALFAALLVVTAQALVVDLETRAGKWLTPLLPPVILLGIALTSLFSGRNLRLLLTQPGADAVDVVWVTRAMTASLLAFAVARVVVRLREPTPLPTDTSPGAAGRGLFLATLIYFFGVVVVPMSFSENPGFTHRGIVVFVVFVAAYLSRHEPIDLVLRAARWSLVAMLVASVAAAFVLPDLALESNYAGTLPLLNARFWGLSFHANSMGAMAFLLLLLQYLQPSRRVGVNVGVGLLGLVVLVWAQSKTVWLLSLAGFAVLATYRLGRVPGGGMRMGFVAFALLALGAPLLLLPYLDLGPLADWFERSPLAANVATLTGRTAIWSAAIEVWQDSPIFGYGLEAWSVERRMQLGLPAAVHAHNQLMQALSTAGLIGAISLLVFFVALARAAWRAMERTRGASLALLVFIAIRCVSEVPLEVGRILSSDVLALLLLFMILVNQPRRVGGAEAPATAS